MQVDALKYFYPALKPELNQDLYLVAIYGLVWSDNLNKHLSRKLVTPKSLIPIHTFVVDFYTFELVPCLYKRDQLLYI